MEKCTFFVQLSGWICIAKANWPAPLALLWAEAANKKCLRRIIHGFNSPKNASTSWKIMKIRRKKTWKVLEDLLEEYVPVVPRHFLKASDTC
jgi:hypothetical protein